MIDVEGKVKQKENNEIDNVLKSEEEDGDLVKHEDSTIDWSAVEHNNKISRYKVYRHEG